MSRRLGTEFKPCMRTNGKVMMRINIQPEVWAREDVVVALFDSYHFYETWEIASFTKKKVQQCLRNQAMKMAYNGEFDTYYSRQEIIDCQGEGSSLLDVWDCVEFVVDKFFPEFRTEARKEEE